MADPTVTDVFNQLVLVNGKLDQVEVNTSLMANVNTSINMGFTATVGRLDVLTNVEIEAAKLLFHQTRQLDAIMCMLDQISRNTCSILNELDAQTQLQISMAQDMAAMRYLAEAGNPAAALDLSRHEAMHDEMEKCCPSPEPEPPCRYDACMRPDKIEEPKLPKPRDTKDPGPSNPG